MTVVRGTLGCAAWNIHGSSWGEMKRAALERLLVERDVASVQQRIQDANFLSQMFGLVVRVDLRLLDRRVPEQGFDGFERLALLHEMRCECVSEFVQECTGLDACSNCGALADMQEAALSQLHSARGAKDKCVCVIVSTHR